MTATGTTAFNPAASGLTISAFARIGIRPPEFTPQHLSDATNEANLLQVQLGNQQPLLWKSELFSISLSQSDAEYDLPARMIAIQDIYLSTTSGGTTTDRLLFPMSTFEYDAQPNKTQEAPPTAYWINKQISPTITFWQVPDMDSTYTAKVRMLSQIQDVSLTSGQTLDMPYRFLDVYVAGLAYRLARLWKPELEMIRKADYMEAWDAASTTDTQDSVSVYIQPAFSGYYRR